MRSGWEQRMCHHSASRAFIASLGVVTASVISDNKRSIRFRDATAVPSGSVAAIRDET
jgi:hypothetical protein